MTLRTVGHALPVPVLPPLSRASQRVRGNNCYADEVAGKRSTDATAKAVKYQPKQRQEDGRCEYED